MWIVQEMMRKRIIATYISLILSFLSCSALLDNTGPVYAGQKTSHLSSRKYAEVKEIRYWSGPARTRIVIDLNQEVAYKHQLLKSDSTLQKSPRLYIDLTLAKLSPYLKEPIIIESGILKRVRAGQYTADTVRIVLDLESVTDYKVFPLSSPYRVVLDVLGTDMVARTAEEQKVPPLSPPQYQQPLPFKIVLDSGHGGEDPGAIGPTRLKEKDVVLAITKKVRDKIRKELKWEVVMTRDDDRFIRLEDRTAIASTEDGKLFISIHANAAKDRRINGVESFVLGTTKNEVALRLAAKENNISPQKVSDLQIILADLKLNDPAKMTH
jgi:N-acetylmuramoyl-L-alanine amidase